MSKVDISKWPKTAMKISDIHQKLLQSNADVPGGCVLVDPHGLGFNKGHIKLFDGRTTSLTWECWTKPLAAYLQYVDRYVIPKGLKRTITYKTTAGLSTTFEASVSAGVEIGPDVTSNISGTITKSKTWSKSVETEHQIELDEGEWSYYRIGILHGHIVPGAGSGGYAKHVANSRASDVGPQVKPHPLTDKANLLIITSVQDASQGNFLFLPDKHKVTDGPAQWRDLKAYFLDGERFMVGSFPWLKGNS